MERGVIIQMSLEALVRIIVRGYLDDVPAFSVVYENDEVIEADLDDDELSELYDLVQDELNKVAHWYDKAGF